MGTPAGLESEIIFLKLQKSDWDLGAHWSPRPFLVTSSAEHLLNEGDADEAKEPHNPLPPPGVEDGGQVACWLKK